MKKTTSLVDTVKMFLLKNYALWLFAVILLWPILVIYQMVNIFIDGCVYVVDEIKIADWTLPTKYSEYRKIIGRK